MHADSLGRLTSSNTAENGVMVGHRKNFGGKQTFADYSYDNIGNIKHAEYRYDSVPYTFVDYNYDIMPENLHFCWGGVAYLWTNELYLSSLAYGYALWG